MRKMQQSIDAQPHRRTALGWAFATLLAPSLALAQQPAAAGVPDAAAGQAAATPDQADATAGQTAATPDQPEAPGGPPAPPQGPPVPRAESAEVESETAPDASVSAVAETEWKPALGFDAATDMDPSAPTGAAEEPAFERTVNFGVGLRAQYVLDPEVEGANFAHAMGTSIRPYISGEAFPAVKFEANLDSAFAYVPAAGDLAVDPDGGAVSDANGDGALDLVPVATVRLLDAVIKLEPHDLANFWFGRFLPPTDRANLSGPYYQNAWNYPVQSNLYPAIYAGRHDGAAYWGQVMGGRFKWQLGMFDITGGDNPLFAGRLVVNLLDPEPGYYNSSTYYGTKDVLAIGVVGQYQEGGDTVAGTGLDGAAMSADILFEKELSGAGTLSVEAAYYDFEDTDQGMSVWGLLGYLLPGRLGPGALQGVARLQTMMPESGDDHLTLDLAANYILDGHNARFTLNYQRFLRHDDIPSDQTVTLGGQLQL